MPCSTSATNWSAAACWAAFGGVDGTGAITMPLDMTMARFTLGHKADSDVAPDGCPAPLPAPPAIPASPVDAVPAGEVAATPLPAPACEPEVPDAPAPEPVIAVEPEPAAAGVDVPPRTAPA